MTLFYIPTQNIYRNYASFVRNVYQSVEDVLLYLINGVIFTHYCHNTDSRYYPKSSDHTWQT